MGNFVCKDHQGNNAPATRRRRRLSARYLPALLPLLVCGSPSEPIRAVSSAAVAQEANEIGDQIAALYENLSSCAASMGDSERWHIAATIQQEGQRYGYDPLFVLAMIQVESSCSSTARGPTGSVGLIQLQPSVARELARRVGIPWSGTGMLTHPGVNVKLGLHYLTELEERFQDPWIAVAAYNLGPGRIARMPRPLARRTRYVRRILSRYEKLLAEAAGAVQTPG